MNSKLLSNQDSAISIGNVQGHFVDICSELRPERRNPHVPCLLLVHGVVPELLSKHQHQLVIVQKMDLSIAFNVTSKKRSHRELFLLDGDPFGVSCEGPAGPHFLNFAPKQSVAKF